MQGQKESQLGEEIRLVGQHVLLLKQPSQPLARIKETLFDRRKRQV